MCPAPAKQVSLIFVTPYDADTRLVDLATGRYGYGHVALWAGHMAGDEPVVFDSGIGCGVGFRPYSVACAAPSRSVELDPHLSRWVWRRALACSGCGYDYVGLARARRSPGLRFTCSGLVAHCLPVHISSDFPERVSPNDLARYFGVPSWR